MRERTGVPAWLKIQPELGIWVAKFGESGASDTSVLTQGFVKQRKEWHLRALCYRGSSGATVHGRGHSEPAPQPGTAQWDWDSDRLCTAQGLKEMFRYLPWDFGLNLWSLQLTALVSECLSILRDSKVGNYFLLTGSKTHCKLMMLTFFFFFKKQCSLLKQAREQKYQLRTLTFGTSTCCASASWPREFFELSEKAAPSSCEHNKDNHQAWPFMHRMQFSLHSSAQRI